MRFLAIMFSLLLASCGGSSGNDAAKPIPANDKLNGFWNGQINQSGDMRMLVYNGEVFARYGDQGYYGSFTFSDSNYVVVFTLKSAPFSLNDTLGNQFATSAVFRNFVFDGNYSEDTSGAHILGDISGSDYGSFTLTRDDSWRVGSSLLGRRSTWQAEGYSLVINNKSTFKGVQQVSANEQPCNFSGNLSEAEAGLYSVILTNRTSCTHFNRSAIGFAALNADGELEFYLRNGGQLLFMTFAPTEVETPLDPDGDAGGDDEGGGDLDGDDDVTP